ncbi:(methyl)glyoxal oxidase [Ranunculus cassubicifolius]
MPTAFILLFFLCQFSLQPRNLVHANRGGGGQWVVLKDDIGINAMHMQLLNNDHVVIFDRTDFGQSHISLPNCQNLNLTAFPKDCTAHSVVYEVSTNSIRPLTVQTDVWCSSGTVAPNGHLIQTGGFNYGVRSVRTFTPCATCDWNEIIDGLLADRWYATNQKLPNGNAIIVGGRGQANYEFYPKTTTTSSLYSFPFFSQTNDTGEENNLYPFVHLNVDGNLFIYANNRAILFDYVNNVIVREYPSMPGGHPRNYPCTGSSVLLPLKNLGHRSVEAEVLICGGAPRGSFIQAQNGEFVRALNTCGRLKITDSSPEWIMETMPSTRLMGDMILLPTGHVLIVNGVGAGAAGWEFGRDPVLCPVLYRPNNQLGMRFEVQTSSSIPRAYHSTAILLRDGRVLVGGSNPNAHYNFTRVLFPTELRLEAFSPTYLDSNSSSLRPKITSTRPQGVLKYGEKLTVSFSGPNIFRDEGIAVTMIAPSFATHSYSMNQRLLVLSRKMMRRVSDSRYLVEVTMPPSAFLAPPGYYMLFVIYQDIPSEGVWVQIL